jgi:[acyl-carrier-protein] S-malonyltransferase
MNEAAEELAKVMKKMDWKAPDVPVWFNATAETEADPAAIADTMTRQMTSSVFWTQIVNKQYDGGIRSFVELGPKGVLSKMVSQILKGREGVEVKNISGV